MAGSLWLFASKRFLRTKEARILHAATLPAVLQEKPWQPRVFDIKAGRMTLYRGNPCTSLKAEGSNTFVYNKLKQ